MKMFRAVAFVGIALVMASPALAAFISNKSDWDAFSLVDKRVYLMGFYDGWLGLYSATEATQQYKLDLVIALYLSA
jgi:hypothetical protein